MQLRSWEQTCPELQSRRQGCEKQHKSGGSTEVYVNVDATLWGVGYHFLRHCSIMWDSLHCIFQHVQCLLAICFVWSRDICNMFRMAQAQVLVMWLCWLLCPSLCFVRHGATLICELWLSSKVESPSEGCRLMMWSSERSMPVLHHHPSGSATLVVVSKRRSAECIAIEAEMSQFRVSSCGSIGGPQPTGHLPGASTLARW